MKKITLILLFLSLSLFAEKIQKVKEVEKTQKPEKTQKTQKPEKMVLKTIKDEFIIVNNDKGNLTFVNKKYHRKNVVLYLFGSTCSFCQKKVPAIKKLMKNKNVQIIGIHSHKNIGDKALKAYAKKVGFTFDILSFKTDIKMLNFLRDIGVWLGGIPFTILVDEDGNVFEVDISNIDEELE